MPKTREVYQALLPSLSAHAAQLSDWGNINGAVSNLSADSRYPVMADPLVKAHSKAPVKRRAT